MTPTNILGIDIAKDTFQVTLLPAGRARAGTFPNDPAGFRQLSAWLKKHRARTVRACLEATGRYGEDLAGYLYEQGHTVSVVNPLVIKAYARSQLIRNKTDRLDADLIAQYCAAQQPAAWSPPAPEVRELQELVRHYDALQASRQQVRNRLAAGFRSPTVREQLQSQLAFLEQQLDDLREQMRKHIDRHPDLKRQQALLESIPGIGELTAARLQAEDLERFADARSLAAYAGVTPMNQTSGTSLRRKPKLSRIGKASLRRALYMPALVAVQCNPVIRAQYERLLAHGKSRMAALGAAMHKLLRLAYGVLKSGQPFDPNYALKLKIAS